MKPPEGAFAVSAQPATIGVLPGAYLSKFKKKDTSIPFQESTRVVVPLWMMNPRSAMDRGTNELASM